ncbi:MAG: PPOX class F420-dependent oxidoreductase [Anaerolineae bacterium]|nr:PPOX class F420-dependent oxidoreductase [Anaerolineae bacterium]
MPNTVIPDTHKDLVEKPYYAVVTTVMPDGQPQSTVVWADYDGEHIRFNTARGRQKDKNLQDNPKVTLVIVDPNNGFHWLEVRGTAEVTEEGGREQIEALSQKYTGQKYYYGYNTRTKPEDETRVVVRINATKVNLH